MIGHYVYKYVLNGTILYIGKTDADLDVRLRTHGRPGDNICEEAWEELKNAEIYYFQCQNEVMSDVIESELIRRHKPKYNIAKTSDWGGLPFPELEWTRYEFPESGVNASNGPQRGKSDLRTVIGVIDRNKHARSFLRFLLDRKKPESETLSIDITEVLKSIDLMQARAGIHYTVPGILNGFHASSGTIYRSEAKNGEYKYEFINTMATEKWWNTIKAYITILEGFEAYARTLFFIPTSQSRETAETIKHQLAQEISSL